MLARLPDCRGTTSRCGRSRGKSLKGLRQGKSTSCLPRFTSNAQRDIGFRLGDHDMRHQNALALFLLVISALSLLFIPWWAAVLLFLVSYCVAAAITLKVAVRKVERCTGLTRERARLLYRAAHGKLV